MSTLDTITAYLKGKGLSTVAIEGVEGNLEVESGTPPNPAAYNPGENAHGIAQWEGGRWTNLQTFAASEGKAPTDLTAQLDFLWSELQGPESGAYRALLAAQTPAQAATVFDQQYERSSAASLPARVAAAQKLAGTGTVTNAPTDSTNPITDAFGSIFGGWQTDLMGLGLKLAAATVAGALVVVGAYQALHDKGTTT